MAVPVWLQICRQLTDERDRPERPLLYGRDYCVALEDLSSSSHCREEGEASSTSTLSLEPLSD